MVISRQSCPPIAGSHQARSRNDTDLKLDWQSVRIEAAENGCRRHVAPRRILYLRFHSTPKFTATSPSRLNNTRSSSTPTLRAIRLLSLIRIIAFLPTTPRASRGFFLGRIKTVPAGRLR